MISIFVVFCLSWEGNNVEAPEEGAKSLTVSMHCSCYPHIRCIPKNMKTYILLGEYLCLCLYLRMIFRFRWYEYEYLQMPSSYMLYLVCWLKREWTPLQRFAISFDISFLEMYLHCRNKGYFHMRCCNQYMKPLHCQWQTFFVEMWKWI